MNLACGALRRGLGKKNKILLRCQAQVQQTSDAETAEVRAEAAAAAQALADTEAALAEVPRGLTAHGERGPSDLILKQIFQTIDVQALLSRLGS